MSLFRPHYSYRSLLAGILGFLTAVLISYILGFFTISSIMGDTSLNQTENFPTKVHVHADFGMYVGGEHIRFTDEKYQSEVGHKLSDSIHFHDNSDEVIHRHAEGITLSSFFDSLGLTLTDACVTLDDKIEHCTNDTEELQLMVNGTEVPDIENYILADNDRILLYYGDPQNDHIDTYMKEVTDLACMYTGTCPERGTPPTEGCGLTCDVVDDHSHN